MQDKRHPKNPLPFASCNDATVSCAVVEIAVLFVVIAVVVVPSPVAVVVGGFDVMLMVVVVVPEGEIWSPYRLFENQK